MRITVNHLRAKLDIINSMLDQENLSWNTVGAVRLYHAYGATGVQRVMSTSGGVETLCELGTTREAARFLSGMIAALRISQEASEHPEPLCTICGDTQEWCWAPVHGDKYISETDI